MRQNQLIDLNTLSTKASGSVCSHFPGQVPDNKRFYGYKDEKFDGRLRC